MLKVGAIIVYGAEGVCRVTDIQRLSFSAKDDEKEYYILVPESNASGKLYLPKDNQLLMSRVKPLLTYDEIKEIIASNDNIIEWVEDSKARNKYYKELMATYDRRNVFGIAKQLYLVKTGKLPVNVNFTAWMEDVLKKTSQILYSEFSYVVDLTFDELLPFIAGEIDCKQK
ncbi:MAG: CarD family transcriptional regulator [Clostridia bacterium]|nr:CarD family transcriptional regulator [Clostridia bacterium]